MGQISVVVTGVDHHWAASWLNHRDVKHNVLKKFNTWRADQEEKNPKAAAKFEEGKVHMWDNCDKEEQSRATVNIGGVNQFQNPSNWASTMKFIGTILTLEHTQGSTDAKRLNNMIVIPLQTSTTGMMIPTSPESLWFTSRGPDCLQLWLHKTLKM